jgi:hypothetical protein
VRKTPLTYTWSPSKGSKVTRSFRWNWTFFSLLRVLNTPSPWFVDSVQLPCHLHWFVTWFTKSSWIKYYQKNIHQDIIRRKKNLDIKHIMSTSFKKIRSIQTCRCGLTNEDNNRCKKESTYNGYQMQCIYRQNYCKTNELCHVLRVVNSWVLYFLILFGSKMISKNLRSLSSILLSIKF